MGQLQLAGTLSGGPTVVSDAQFSSATFLCAISFQQGNEKMLGVGSGVVQRNLESPSAFAPLSGVGPNDTVTEGNFLYFKSQGDVLLEITSDDGTSGNSVAVVPVSGVFVLETTDAKFIKGLACKGTAAIEYLVTGNQ